jgi:hypothetical protein
MCRASVSQEPSIQLVTLGSPDIGLKAQGLGHYPRLGLRRQVDGMRLWLRFTEGLVKLYAQVAF